MKKYLVKMFNGKETFFFSEKDLKEGDFVGYGCLQVIKKII